MTRKQKKSLYRILLGGAIFLLATLLQIENPYVELAVYLIAYAITGGDVIQKQSVTLDTDKFLMKTF